MLQDFLKRLHASQSIRFGTFAPFSLGDVQIERVGFSNTPLVHVEVVCPSPSIKGVLPVVRQFVYHELQSWGLSEDVVEFIPTIQRGKRRKFLDINESSKTLGKNKMGQVFRVGFEIKPEHIQRFKFEWNGKGSLKQ